MTPSPPLLRPFAAALGLLLGFGAMEARAAENIDPLADGSRHAYGENVGWLNAEPGGEGGPGAIVTDSGLAGYLWSENVGWVSLSCANTSSCATVIYGVDNDGAGTLTGLAWGENVGWINFAPTGAGVVIDTATGTFTGRAWGENIGWVTFSSASPVAYAVRTSWPVGSLSLDASAYAAAEGAGIATITVRRTGGSKGAVGATVSTADGTATAPADYMAVSQMVGFADGDDTAKTVDVTIVDDTLAEGDETVQVSLGSVTGGAYLASPTSGAMTILDHAGSLQFSSAGYTVGETAGAVAVTVTRTGGAGGTVGATFSTVDGTAAAPGDYAAVTEAVIFAAGDAVSKQVQVPVVYDAESEGDETVSLFLSGATGGASLGAPSASTLTITDSGLPGEETIDPLVDGSRYAYGENVGWLNAEPGGPGEFGVKVGDSGLAGYLWSENVGWVSLSCANTSSCATVIYGVDNDGAGTLTGLAWGENVGWINFAPTGAGVVIDTATGTFTGRAWGENIGWVTFSSAGPVAYSVRAGCPDDDGDMVPDAGFLCTGAAVTDCNDLDPTSWAAPSEIGAVSFSADTQTISWDPPVNPGGTMLAYDAIRSGTSSDFTGPAVCVESADGSDTQAMDFTVPPPGAVFHYLIRALNACPAGTGTLGAGSNLVERVGRSCP